MRLCQAVPVVGRAHRPPRYPSGSTNHYNQHRPHTALNGRPPISRLALNNLLGNAASAWLQLTHGKWLMGLGGVVSVIWGILLILVTIAGALVLTWWMGAYALFFGGALLALAFRLRHRHAGA